MHWHDKNLLMNQAVATITASLAPVVSPLNHERRDGGSWDLSLIPHSSLSASGRYHHGHPSTCEILSAGLSPHKCSFNRAQCFSCFTHGCHGLPVIYTLHPSVSPSDRLSLVFSFSFFFFYGRASATYCQPRGVDFLERVQLPILMSLFCKAFVKRLASSEQMRKP